MEKMSNRYSIIILLIRLFFISGCKTSPQNKTDFDLNNDSFHFALYAYPSKDCLSCLEKTLKILDQKLEPDEKLLVLVKDIDDLKDFEKFVATKFPQRVLALSKVDLSLPHPSLLLLKNRSVYMHVYISSDDFEYYDTITKCMEILELQKNELEGNK